MKYAVDCFWHGTVELSEADYARQMRREDATWRCPQCGGDAEWNDDVYEAWAYPEKPFDG